MSPWGDKGIGRRGVWREFHGDSLGARCGPQVPRSLRYRAHGLALTAGSQRWVLVLLPGEGVPLSSFSQQTFRLHDH